MILDRLFQSKLISTLLLKFLLILSIRAEKSSTTSCPKTTLSAAAPLPATIETINDDSPLSVNNKQLSTSNFTGHLANNNQHNDINSTRITSLNETVLYQPINSNNNNSSAHFDLGDDKINLNITDVIFHRFYYLFESDLKQQSTSSTSTTPAPQQQQQQTANQTHNQTPNLSKRELSQVINNGGNISISNDDINTEMPMIVGFSNGSNNNNFDTSFNYDSTKVQSILENRKIDQEDNEQRKRQKLRDQLHYFQRRSFFKILNRVFSRVDLPEVYQRSNVRQRGSHCGQHIGCVEEIPNFPSLLKKPNVSSSFTIYTSSNPKSGFRIPYEPILHHQLQDANTTETDIENNLNSTTGNDQTSNRLNQRRKFTAASWRTAYNIIQTQEFPFDLALLEQSNFDPSQTTRIIVGGYFAKEDEEWIDEVVRQWLILDPSSNIIKVSWADANRGLYHTAAYNSRIVGRQLTLFLYYLDQLFHIDLSKFHLVGHSLGAHIAGFVGADNDGNIARITGLDPAGPIFVELSPGMRLDPSDAKFVDVVHTNGGSITKGALGLSTPSGHVDYYCNGGSIQPGCYFSSVTRSIMDPVERVACSHRRSYRYFIEIIKLTISREQAAAEAARKSQDSSQWDNSPSSKASLPINDAMLNTNFSSNQGHEDISMFSASGLAGVRMDKRSGEPLSFLRRAISFHLPKAFLFEAKQEDLVKLTQPDLMLLSPKASMRREITDMAPLKHPLEFHLLRPDFPTEKRGMYFIKTRSEPPFFSSKQYALTMRTDNVIRRKITLSVKVEQTLVAEVEIDEIPGVLTVAFTPNDPRIMEPNREGRGPSLYLMWKQRSFNLLQLNQQSELHLKSIQLSLLDELGEENTISGSSIMEQSNNITLNRNQWHKFESSRHSASLTGNNSPARPPNVTSQ